MLLELEGRGDAKANRGLAAPACSQTDEGAGEKQPWSDAVYRRLNHCGRGIELIEEPPL